MSSSHNLAEILGKINDGICVLDCDQQVSFVNEKASQILEAKDEAFHGKITEAMKQHSLMRFEHFHASLNQWFEHHTYPNADGGLTVISCDTTARHRIEEALRASEERMRSIVEVGRILASSLECEKMFAELAEFIVSKLADSCVIFVREDGELVRLASAHSMPLVAESELQSELEHVMTTGQAKTTAAPVSRIIVPLKARSDVTGALAVTSARPRAYDAEDLHLFQVFGRRAAIALENARLYQETQKANRLKDEFVAIVSHELRTPLTPILGGVYMMRSEPHDETIFARALDLIERNAKTQVKIVDDLLDVSRALSGKLRINMEPVDLSRVIHAAVETVRPASEAKSIQIDVRLGSINGMISGDADRLQQVVWNLLANSVKFTPHAGRIVIELLERSGHAEIRVTDTGVGIEAEFLPHIFEKFQQADTSRTRSHGGLGLGLAIVRHIVESHGGTVHAQSSGGEQGATFVVRLPLRSAARTTMV